MQQPRLTISGNIFVYLEVIGGRSARRFKDGKEVGESSTLVSRWGSKVSTTFSGTLTDEILYASIAITCWMYKQPASECCLIRDHRCYPFYW